MKQEESVTKAVAQNVITMNQIEQIVSFGPSGRAGSEDHADIQFNFNKALMESILKATLNDNIFIISICGPRQSGKSFVMNYILRHLKAKAENPDIADEDPLGWGQPDIPEAPLDGFPWTQNKISGAGGVWLTTVPVILKSSEKSVSVYLMDTEFTSEKESADIFKFCLRFSNVLIFNSPSGVLGTFFETLEQVLDNLTPATSELLFLVRDWELSREFGEAGGRLFKQQLFSTPANSNYAKKIQSKVGRQEYFLLPHPGVKSAKVEFNGSLASILPEFSSALEELLLFIFQGDRLFHGKFALGSEMIANFARLEICSRFQNSQTVNATDETLPHQHEPQPTSHNCSPEELNQVICNRIAETFEAKLRAKVNHQTLPTFILNKLQNDCERGAIGALRSERLHGSFKVRQRAEKALRDKIEAIRDQSHQANDRKFTAARATLVRERDKCLSSYDYQLNALINTMRDAGPEIMNSKIQSLQADMVFQFRNRVGGRNYHCSLLNEFSRDLTQTMETRAQKKTGEVRQHEHTKKENQWHICKAKIETEYKNEMKTFMKSAPFYSATKLQKWHRLLSEKFKHGVELPSNEEYQKKLEEFLSTLFNQILESNQKEKNAFLSKLNDRMQTSSSAYMSRMKDVLNTTSGLTPESLLKHSQDAKEWAAKLFKEEILTSVDAEDAEFVQEIMAKFDEHITEKSQEIQRVFQAQTQLKKRNIVTQYVDKFKAKMKSFREVQPFASFAAINQVRQEFEKDSKSSLLLTMRDIGDTVRRELLKDIEVALNKEVTRNQEEVDAAFGKQRKAAEKIVQDLVLRYAQNGVYCSIQDLEDWQTMKMKSLTDNFKSTCPLKDEAFMSEFISHLRAKLQVQFNNERKELSIKLEKEETVISQKIGLELHTYKQELKSFLKTKDFHLPADLLRKHQKLVDTMIINMKLANITRNGKDKIDELTRPLYEKYKERNDMNTPVESPAIGIDLGTTYCCVAVYQKGQVQVIPTADYKDLVPSYVGLHPQEELVGEIAKTRAHEYPADTIFDAKRLIGRKFSDPLVQKDIKLWPFTVSQKMGTKDTPVIHARGVKYEPEQISAKLLAHLKTQAEKYLGKPVEKAVITVPAYFNDGQRQATIDAGEIAGLEVLHILNEPTAAAIAYYLHHSSGHGSVESMRLEKNILVYDLGGGTFDVSVLTLRIGSGEIQVRAVNGDTHVGGEDFDNKMVEFCIEKFRKQKGVDLTKENGAQTLHISSPYASVPVVSTPAMRQRMMQNPSIFGNGSQIPRRLRRIRNVCEDVKKNLSFAESGAIVLDAIFNGIDMNIPITRKDFEQMNQEYFDKTLEIVVKALADAKLQKHDIDEIVLVGGSTRIPKVKQMVEDYFGKMSMTTIDPDKAVAHGAAALAAKLNGRQEQKVKNILLQDVCPLSIGVEVEDGSLSVVVPRNTQLPTIKRNNHYSTARDSQTSACIRIFEGEEKVARKNHLLGEFTLRNIPSRKCGEEKLTVNMELNEAGILHVTATCESTGESNQITINEQKGRLTRHEIKTLRAQMV